MSQVLGMDKATLFIALDVAAEFVPFTDVVSDILLLLSVWPSTRVVAPSDVDSCEERALWYLALACTVVGTLVDLMPEAMLLTEILLHPGVLTSSSSMKTLIHLIFSDGKPIVVFASSGEAEKPLHPSLHRIRDSLRRRFTSVAAGLSMQDGCMADQKPRWTYAGVLGVLVGGELLTGIGASLFLRVEFGWAALLSLLGSIFALLTSTRYHMRKVGEMPLHECHELGSEQGGRLIEFLIPGPLTLVRFLLLVPVWPMIVVYAEAVSFWPFSTSRRGEYSRPHSSDALWVSPPDWLEVAVPNLGTSDNDSGLSYLYWAIIPHLLWTVISATWTATLGISRLICWYFGHVEDWSVHSWGVYFSSQESPFNVWARHIQRALGLGFTIFLSRGLLRTSMGFIVFASVLFQAMKRGTCAEQEWTFVYSQMAWWAIMVIGHVARHRNLFRAIPNAEGVRVADRW